MTEAEWLAAVNSWPLLRFIEPKASDRKLVCLDVACARRIAPLLIHPATQHAVDVLERFVEGQCKTADFGPLDWAVEGAAYCVEAGHAPWQNAAEQLPDSLFAELVADSEFAAQGPRSVLASAAYFVFTIFHCVPFERRLRGRPANCPSGPFRPVALVHEVFGNPFRPVTFDPAWRSDTALSLARVMYESRDFAAMPILADALQDAGCEHADVLTHCRGSGVHVRGCWVVDLVLGKS